MLGSHTGVARRQPAIDDEQAWTVFVDSVLPEIWCTIQRSGVTPEEGAGVCELVFLRLLEAVEGPSAPAAFDSAARDLIRRIAVEECERAQRLAAWQSARSSDRRQIA